MLVSELVDYTREHFLDDTIEPYFWSDDFLTNLALEAEKEACIRASLIIRTIILHTQEGVDTYTLSDDIIKPIRMFVNYQNSTYEILQVNLANIEHYNAKGLPVEYSFIDDSSIIFYPIPDRDYEVKLIASVYPQTTVSFEIPEKYQKYLAYYIAGNALLKQDLDVSDMQKAAEFLAMFNSKFGENRTLKAMRREKFGGNVHTVMASTKRFGFP